jgi:hypothetical protein
MHFFIFLGGDPINAFNFLTSRGAALMSDYPYIDSQGSCRIYSPQKLISNVCYYSNSDEEMLKKLLLKAGPLVLAMSKIFQNY